MPAATRLVLDLDPDLATQLAAASAETGYDPANIVMRALRHHLDGVTAYGSVADDLALIKGALADLAGAVGEALSDPEPGAIDAICRYQPGTR